MAGLLDSMLDSPNSQGMYALASGLLGVRKGGEGRAFMGALNAYNQAQQEQRRNELVQLQRKQIEAMLKRQERQDKDDDAVRGLFSNPANYMTAGSPEVQGNEMDVGQPGKAPAFDQQRLIQTLLRSGNPALVQKAMELSAKSPLMKVGAGESLVDPTNPTKPIFTAPNKPADDPAEWRLYEKARAQGYRGDFTQWKKELNASGASTNNVSYGAPIIGMGPDGKPIFYRPDNRGGMTPTGVSPPPDKAETKPMNDTQANASLYSTRMEGADRIINDLEGKYSRARLATKQSLGDGVMGTVANVALSPEEQMADQAQRDFLNAVLRRESGAVISPSEFDNGKRQYFPQPGDSIETVRQKAKNRKTAIEGIRAAAGPRAPVNQGSQQGSQSQSVDDLLRIYGTPR